MIKLRNWQKSDVDLLVLRASNPKIARNMTDSFPNPFTKEIAVGFIEKHNQTNPTRVFAIDFEGEPIGAIGIHPQDDIMRKNAELGYWIGEDFWGRGFATEAVKLIVEYGFRTFDIVRIYARPFGYNGPSARLLEKNGFRLEAKFENTIYKNGKFQDELIYAIRK